MVFQWVINGVLIILNENGPINGTEMPLTVHHFHSKHKKQETLVHAPKLWAAEISKRA